MRQTPIPITYSRSSIIYLYYKGFFLTLEHKRVDDICKVNVAFCLNSPIECLVAFNQCLTKSKCLMPDEIRLISVFLHCKAISNIHI